MRGVITAFQQCERTADITRYVVVLEASLALLRNSLTYAVYQHKSVIGVVEDILKRWGYSSLDYRYALKTQYPVREFYISYAESDLSFIERHLAHVGVFYYFVWDEENHRDVLVLGDYTHSFAEEKNMAYRHPSGLFDGGLESLWEMTINRRSVSGFAVGVVISYAIPVEGHWRWKRPSAHAVRLAAKYGAGGIVFLLAGLWIPHGFILLWLAAALLMVAAGYTGLGVSVFQKNNHGDLSLSARWMLFPYLAGTWLSKQWFSRRISLSNVVYDGVALGRFPDRTMTQAAVFDLTAEFHKGRRKADHWEAYPLMDLVVPGVRDIHQAVMKLSQLQQEHESVLVCCALGLSRSATVVAAWLLSEGLAGSVTQAVALIKSRRPQVVLTPAHLQVLETFSKELQCQISLRPTK
ncbi:dual specificity protein phosphatase family protein [Klebsiella aerogenes]|nr:dual specificity protein phosphatase family protein [Klebsiella aerogenes]